MTNSQESIDQAKSEFLRAKQRLSHVLATTPDERIAWSPAPTARTPAQVVAHAALAIGTINDFLDGRPFLPASTAAADTFFLEQEREITTREQAQTLLDQKSDRFVAWLEALTPDRLDTIVLLPFGMGSAPLSALLDIPENHTLSHVSQIEYIQTAYGDRDWHIG